MTGWPSVAWLGYLLLALYCQNLSSAKWLLAAQVPLLLLAIPGTVWIPLYITSFHCTGSMLKGVVCPEQTIWTQLISYHSFVWFYCWIYTVFALPFLLVATGLGEYALRRKAIRRARRMFQ